MNLRSPLIRIPLWALGLYLALCVVVWLFQRRLMYFPDTGAAWVESGMDEVTLDAADGTKVKATWWPGTRPLSLLLFHGNAGHRGHRYDWMRPLQARGWSVLLVDYRGYGGSEGRPSQPGIAKDADAALAWLRAKQPRDRIVYFGESIGASVAMDLARRAPPDGLIVHAGALDVVDVARGHYPFLPVGLLLRDRWNARDVTLDMPLFVLHGDRDRIIPPRHGRAIYESASGPKEWWNVEGAGHNDVTVRAGRVYYEKIDAFLQSLATERREPS